MHNAPLQLVVFRMIHYSTQENRSPCIVPRLHIFGPVLQHCVQQRSVEVNKILLRSLLAGAPIRKEKV